MREGAYSKAASLASKPLQRPEVSEVAGTDDELVSDEEAPADNENEMPVQVKLANFWPNNAAVWFVRAEQEFVIKSVSTQATMYAYLVQALTEEVSMRVADRLIAAPSDTPYDDLKAHLLQIYTKTDYQVPTPLTPGFSSEPFFLNGCL